MVEFYHVYKQYVDDQLALTDVSFTIQKGEFVFLTGASGAGKTTLLKLIFKEEFPSRGQILIDSVNTNLIPANQLYQLRRNLGIVFQDFRLLQNRTIYENIALPLIVRGEKKSAIDRMVMAALTLVGLTHRKNYIPMHISGGEQQRVAIARAIVGNPRILIADEPTGNLDTELSIDVFRMFERIHATGITVIIATHNTHMMELFPRRVLRLEKGALIADGTTMIGARDM
ncbi:MAG: cell division ATP-binding protein FtsE [Candidatus Omnitrophota bacterium]